MHFTTLFLLKGKTLEDISIGDIYQLYGESYCYSCGESTPKYLRFCDWFQVGGRWSDILKAKKGIKGDTSWANDEKSLPNTFSVCEIKDLMEPIKEEQIYSIATKSRMYIKGNDYSWFKTNNEKYEELLRKINNKEINGVIALIDNHD